MQREHPAAGRRVIIPYRLSSFTCADLTSYRLNISKLMAEKVIEGAFPLHDYDSLKSLQIRWLNMLSAPWNQVRRLRIHYFVFAAHSYPC